MYNLIDLQDTIIALATPAGMGAIAVIRLSGSQAINVVNAHFKAKNLDEVPSHTVHLGYIRNEQNRIIDQVLVSVFKAPNSYTKENVVEISCHGSRFIQQQLLELFIRQGVRLAKEGEFTLRAFLNGQMDLSQAEAVADLIAAESESAHQLALQQMRGGFSQEIQKLREELIHFASMIELELDFGEEDVEFADRDDLKELVTKILNIIKRLLDSFQLGNAIKNGVSTVIAGRPNAGKSTLLNALLNEERAIVSNIAGTTRDTIEEILNIQGIQFRLIDTAGIREATDQIEAIGVEKTYQKIAQSAILVYVYDITDLSPFEVENDLQKLERVGMNIVVIANKWDEFCYKEDHHALDKKFFEKEWLEKEQKIRQKYNYIRLSAKDKSNIKALHNQLFELVSSGQTQNQDNIVSNTRHYAALQAAYESLNSVLDGLENGITGDFVAMDIRHAINYLGEIVGSISSDDLLGNIFSRFCIGK